jgi:cytochrome c5
MKKAIIVSSVVFLAACSSKMMMPVQADADKLASNFPGTTLVELTEGRNLMKEHCGKCHDMPNPSTHDETYWKNVVPPMGDKAHLDAPQTDKILKYALAVNMHSK